MTQNTYTRPPLFQDTDFAFDCTYNGIRGVRCMICIAETTQEGVSMDEAFDRYLFEDEGDAAEHRRLAHSGGVAYWQRVPARRHRVPK